MALDQMLEEMEMVSRDPKYNFTPEARSDMKDMIKTGRSAKEKIAKISGHEVKLDPFTPGDEEEFLTKES